MNPPEPKPDERLERIMRRFETFASAYPELPLYRSICEGASRDREVAGLLLAAAPARSGPSCCSRLCMSWCCGPPIR